MRLVVIRPDRCAKILLDMHSNLETKVGHMVTCGVTEMEQYFSCNKEYMKYKLLRESIENK